MSRQGWRFGGLEIWRFGDLEWSWRSLQPKYPAFHPPAVYHQSLPSLRLRARKPDALLAVPKQSRAAPASQIERGWIYAQHPVRRCAARLDACEGQPVWGQDDDLLMGSHDGKVSITGQIDI